MENQNEYSKKPTRQTCKQEFQDTNYAYKRGKTTPKEQREHATTLNRLSIAKHERKVKTRMQKESKNSKRVQPKPKQEKKQ